MVPWIVLAYVPWMVELLHGLACAAKVDDAAKARVSKNSEIRNFKFPPIFGASANLCDWSRDQISASGCTIAQPRAALNAPRVNRVVN
jgi:hypothetical protein